MRLEALRFLGLSERATDEEALECLAARFPCLTQASDDPGWDEYCEQYDKPFVEPLEEVVRERAFIDPAPYLKKLLARLPGIDQRFPGTDAELRPLVEHGLKDPQFGLRLLVEDPRFDGILPQRALTVGSFREPTASEKAHRLVLGPERLIAEEREYRYTVGVGKDGKLVARPLSRPFTQEELVPVVESRTYQPFLKRLDTLSADWGRQVNPDDYDAFLRTLQAASGFCLTILWELKPDCLTRFILATRDGHGYARSTRTGQLAREGAAVLKALRTQFEAPGRRRPRTDRPRSTPTRLVVSKPVDDLVNEVVDLLRDGDKPAAQARLTAGCRSLCLSDAYRAAILRTFDRQCQPRSDHFVLKSRPIYLKRQLQSRLVR